MSEEATKVFKKINKIQSSQLPNMNWDKWIKKNKVADECLKSFLKTWDGTGNASEKYQQYMKESASATSQFGATLKSMATNMATMLIINLAIQEIVWIADKLVETYEEATEKFEESKQAYEEAKSTLESLNSELKTTQKRIEELNSQETLTLAEESELEKLKKENDELERKISLQEKVVAAKEQSNRTNAENLLTKKDDYVDTNLYMSSDSELYGGVQTVTGNNSDILQELVNRRNLAKKELETIEKQLADNEDNWILRWQKKAYESAIKDYEEEMSTRATTISDAIEYLDPNSYIYAVNNSALNMYNNMDLEGLELQLANIESYFNGSATRNAVKKKIIEATKAGKNASDVLKELNVDIEGAGLEVNTLNSYFEELANTSNKVAKSINKVDGTFDSISVAFESEDVGKTYDEMVDFLEKALDLYDNGLWGKDEFKEVAQWMTSEDIFPDSDDLKYDAQAYKQAFENTYQMVQDWFNPDDELGSMWAFVDDLYTKNSNLFSKLDKQSGEVIFNFNDTAEAAEALGVNVRLVDTMLRKLEDHGFEFDNMFFSSEMADEYKSAIDTLEATANSLADKNTKKRFKELIDSFRNDINYITEDKIINVKFEIDQATLATETENIEKEIESTGGTVEQYGAANYNKSKMLSKYESGDFDESSDKEYQNIKEQIKSLEEDLAEETDAKKKIEIQKQISVLYDMLIDFQQKNSDNKNASWIKYFSSDSDDAIGVLTKLMEASEDTKDSIAKTLDIDIDKLYANQVKNAIDHIEEYGGTITFEADVNNVKQTVKAVENEDGTISYTTIIDGETVTISGYEEIPINKQGEIEFLIEANTGEKTTLWDMWWKTALETPKIIFDFIIGVVKNDGMAKEVFSNGTAHSTGTALWNNYRQKTGQAYAGGNWGLHNNQHSLINELGSEIIVRDGKWFTVNNGYPTFANLKKGDIIFNHKQSKELLKNGYVTGSHARMVGNAHAQGTAYNDGGILGTPSNTEIFDGSNSGNSDNNKHSFNWIETILSRIQRDITNLGKTVSATYKSWTTRNSELAEQIAAVKKEYSLQQQALDAYTAKAKAVNLPPSLKEKVREGTIAIEEHSGSTVEMIQEYQEWYEKTLACEDAMQDLKDELASLAKLEFDNVAKMFDNQLSGIEHETAMLDSYINLAETSGQLVSEKYYSALIKAENDNFQLLEQEHTALTTALPEAMSTGNIEEYSEDWYSMMSSINDVEKALTDSKIALIEYENAARDLKWDNFDKLQERITQITEESDFLIDLVSDEKLVDDNGNMTDLGQASLGLHTANYQTYLAQAEKYAEELGKINEALAEDPYNQTLLERQETLIQSQRDMISAAEDEKDALKDLYSEGYDALLNNMSEVIDKRKDMFSQIKDLYDYEKNIAEQTKEIAALEKQLSAYQGDDSEETRTTIQQLNVSLEEAKQNLEETEYDKYISDQEQMLDSLYSETEAWVNERLDNVDALIRNAVDSASINAESIMKTLQTVTNDVGITLSNKMDAIWSSGGTIGSVLAMIEKEFTASEENADKQAEEQLTATPEPTVTSPAPTTSNTPTTTSTSSSWGSWFVSKKDSYPKSKLRGETSIVDRLKLHDYDSSFHARASYYAAMGGSGTYTGSASQNQWMLSQMKSHAGFAKGGVIGNLINRSGEDGFALVRRGEGIIPTNMMPQWEELIQNLQPVNQVLAAVKNVQIPSSTQNSNHNVTNHNTFEFHMPNVTNGEETITYLQHSKRFENIIHEISFGKGNLGKYKY